MPPKSTTDDEIPLKGEFTKLRDAGWLPINLAADAHFPTHLMIAARDHYASELLRRALGDAFNIPQLPDTNDEEDTSDTGGEESEGQKLESSPDTDDEEDTSDIEEEENNGQKLEGDPAYEVVLRPSDKDDKLAPGVALYDLGGTICQVVSSKTPQFNSVLGRVGTVDILCSQLTKRLRQRGIRQVVTRTLAAQLAYGTTEQLDASVKQLERLNRGDYISEQNLDRFAQAFGLRVEDLVFTHPAIYEVEAWKRRKKETQNARRKSTREHRLHFLPLLGTEPNRISELIIKRCSGLRLRFEQQGLSSLEQKKSAAHMTAALLSSPSSTALRDALGALVELQDSGAAVWLSEYEDLVPVADGELDNVGPYTAPLPSRWEHVAMIVFCGAGSAPEKVVDLSHTVGVGPRPDWPVDS